MSVFIPVDQNRDILNTDCLSKMQDCIKSLEDITVLMFSGSIAVKYLRRIAERKKNYLDVCSLIVGFKPQFANLDSVVPNMAPMEVLTKVLELRTKELKRFSEIRSLINLLMTLCKEIDPGEFQTRTFLLPFYVSIPIMMHL